MEGKKNNKRWAISHIHQECCCSRHKKKKRDMVLLFFSFLFFFSFEWRDTQSVCALPRWREGRLERWVALVHNQERSFKKGLSRHLCCCCCCCCCWSGTKITPIRCRYIHKNPYAAQCIFLSSFFLVSSQGRLLEIPLTRSSQNVCYTSYRYYISVRRNFFFFTRRLDKALEKKRAKMFGDIFL